MGAGYMKITKTVTTKVMEANQANSAKGTGPRNTAAVSQTATKHGLLAKKLQFQSEEEKSEFDQLVREIEEEQKPDGRLEQALIEEAAVCLWKLQSANDWEGQELANRRETSKAILKNLTEHYDEEKLPMFKRWDSSSPARLGWDCQELTVRSGTIDSEKRSGDRNSKAGKVQIEARMTTSLDTILRYQAAIKRDLYRALTALRDMRRDRNNEN
jgi:hypothetical protein